MYKITNDYKTNKYGVIVSPGKFEGELAIVPDLYNAIEKGGEDNPIELYDDEIEWLKEHDVDAKYAFITEDDTGFVYATFAKRYYSVEVTGEVWFSMGNWTEDEMIAIAEKVANEVVQDTGQIANIDNLEVNGNSVTFTITEWKVVE